MDDLQDLIERSRKGETRAYGTLVRRYQDMAVGYAFSLLCDFQLAEDAAQEAFLEGYRTLPQLRQPAAFPGWLRCIVFKHCDRLTRGKDVNVIEVQSALSLSAEQSDPSHTAEEREMKEVVRRAIAALPESEREVTTLFYIGEHSQEEIAGFLDLPLSTIKNRLRSAREHLKEWILDRIEADLQTHRPSRSDDFAREVVRLICDGIDPEGNRFAITSNHPV